MYIHTCSVLRSKLAKGFSIDQGLWDLPRVEEGQELELVKQKLEVAAVKVQGISVAEGPPERQVLINQSHVK